MRLTDLPRKILVLAIALFLLTPCSFLRAEKVALPAKGFSIAPSEDWTELPLPLQGVVVSYSKKGTLATFHITERNLEGVRSVEQLKWEDLFSPEFASIEILKESVTVLAGEKAKFCIYVLKPGEFKSTMEGKLPAKYINYVLIHQGKLFSVTFRDAQDGFALNYPSFLAAIRTLQFNTPVQPGPRRNV
jgi:hypothetical protein